MRHLALCLLLAVPVFSAGCAGGQRREEGPLGTASASDLARLAAWLPGEYDNHEQVIMTSTGTHTRIP